MFNVIDQMLGYYFLQNFRHMVTGHNTVFTDIQCEYEFQEMKRESMS